jgi:acetylornithine aminotransferase
VPTIDDIYDAIDEQTVAVLLELVQGEGGVEPLDKAKIQKLSAFLKQKGVLLIVDEVQTGIYRTGEMLASNLYEIEPDIITLAKGLGGGVPIGVVMSRHKDIFSYGDHGSTFGGNYLSTAASNAVLDILSSYKDSGKLDEIMIYFEQKLQDIAQKYSHIFIKHVGLGLMRGLRVKDGDTLNTILKESIKHKVVVLKAGRNTVRFLPSLTITKDEIDKGLERFEKVLDNL